MDRASNQSDSGGVDNDANGGTSCPFGVGITTQRIW
jgi:hypothetical protein